MDEVFRAINARDDERLSELVAEEWYVVDHRTLGWEDARGREQCLALMRSTLDSPSLRVEFDELIACDDRLIVTGGAWRGRGVKAGELQVAVDGVYLVENLYSELAGAASQLGPHDVIDLHVHRPPSVCTAGKFGD